MASEVSMPMQPTSPVDAEYGVGALQTREAELRSFYAYVVEVEGAFVGLFYRQAHHYSCGKVDKVDFQYFRHKRE